MASLPEEYWFPHTLRPVDLLECAGILSDVWTVDETGKQVFSNLSEELQTFPELSGDGMEEDPALGFMSSLSETDSYTSSEYLSSAVDSFSEVYAQLEAPGSPFPLQQTMDCEISHLNSMPESSGHDGGISEDKSVPADSKGCGPNCGRKQKLVTRNGVQLGSFKSRNKARRTSKVSVGSATSSEDLMESQRKKIKTPMYQMNIEDRNMTQLEKKHIIKSKRSKDYREKVKNKIKTLEAENLGLKQEVAQQEKTVLELNSTLHQMKRQLEIFHQLINSKNEEIARLEFQSAAPN